MRESRRWTDESGLRCESHTLTKAVPKDVIEKAFREEDQYWVPTAKKWMATTWEINAIRRMATQGISRRECAKRIGRSQSFVRKWSLKYDIAFAEVWDRWSRPHGKG